MTKKKSNLSSPAARILIVDNHPIVREALAMRIAGQPDLEVCGEAANVAEALRLVDSANPDLAIIEIALGTGTGIDLIKRIKARHGQVRMLVCSMYTEAHFADRALRAGAMGYITKDNPVDKILEAIRRVLDGRVYLSELFAEEFLNRVVGRGGQLLERSAVEALSDRELEVLRLMGQGLDRNEIAKRLRISVKTVETYRGRLKEKLHVKNATNLLRYAVQWGEEA